MNQNFFTYHPLFPSDQLPPTVILLDDWALITVNGKDSFKYLQGQLTCNLLALGIEQFSFTAHCNSAGKMLSHSCVLYYHGGIALIERRSVILKEIEELRKYAVFSKTEIDIDENVILLGIAGFCAQKIVKKFFNNIPDFKHPVVHDKNATLLLFNLPTPRFLLITKPSIFNMLQDQLQGQVQFSTSPQWLLLDIEAGYPVIDIANSFRFTPQAVNAEELNSVSFEKGCFLGQEAVARIKYRGINKRALYRLCGNACFVPKAGEHLEIKIKHHWRCAGTVLAACCVHTNNIWIQAVLSKDIPFESKLRVFGDQTGNLKIYTKTADKLKLN